jgi:hypothetical protein
MLGSISQAKDIPPPFHDKNGAPDVFPALFTNPETGYCQPYPDWTSKLTKQAEWVPTYLARFKNTIPNNGSALSAVLRGLSDEQIIAYMHDGPFMTSRNMWHTPAVKPPKLVMQLQLAEHQK